MVKKMFLLNLTLITFILISDVQASKVNKSKNVLTLRKDFNRLFKKGMYFSSYYPFIKIRGGIKSKNKTLKIEKILENKMLIFKKKTFGFKRFKNCNGDEEKNTKQLREHCYINSARIKYAQKNFRDGLKDLEKVKIYSGAWPYLLREKAWFHYNLKNYRKVLGLVLTYDSPFLSGHKKPEDKYLEVLSYYKLCLYGDAIHRGKNFLLSSKSLVKKYKEILNLIKNKPNLIWLNLKNKKGERDLLNDYRNRIIIDDFFIRDKKMMLEWRGLKKRIGLKNRNKIRSHLKKMIKVNRKKLMKHYRYVLARKIKENVFYRKAILNLNAEIFKRKRNQVYKFGRETKILKKKNIKIKTVVSGRDVYPFRGAFWVDELGHYQSILDSHCLTEKGREL